MKYVNASVWFAILFLLETGSSMACSVCKGGDPPERADAYLMTTGILAALPILMSLFLFLWFRKINRNG
jgi:hypothetical protein